MSKKQAFKLIILLLLAGVVIACAGLAVRWSNSVTQSEDTLEVFTNAAELPPELVDAVDWLPDDSTIRRKVEPLTRQDVTATWIRAWEQFGIISETNDVSGLETYFLGSALEAILESVNSSKGEPVHQLSHQLKVNFYSQDGQIIGLRANEVKLLRSLTVGDSTSWVIAKEAYDAVLILEDGNWRIQHWVRTEAKNTLWTDPAPKAANIERLPVSGINYYPKEFPFENYWENFDEEVAASDLDKVVELGLDSVRIFLPFDQFGGRWVSSDTLEPVIQFMDSAAERDLGVVVTLFDGRTDHRTAMWDADFDYINGVVNQLRDHPSLVLWDLKNEPDLDIGKNGVDEQLLYAWLGQVAREVREIDPVTPTTVGWSSAAAALKAPHYGDVLTFHHYLPADQLYSLVPLLEDHAAGGPVILTEYGLPTYNSGFPGGHTEKEQAVYVADTLKVVRDTSLQGSMIWTLWDFDSAPQNFSKNPVKSGEQKKLGVLRSDGTEKLSATLLAPGADLDSVQAGLLHRLTAKTFWRLIWLGLLMSAVGYYIYVKWRKSSIS